MSISLPLTIIYPLLWWLYLVWPHFIIFRNVFIYNVLNTIGIFPTFLRPVPISVIFHQYWNTTVKVNYSSNIQIFNVLLLCLNAYKFCGNDGAAERMAITYSCWEASYFQTVVICLLFVSHFILYSRMSPGWQSKALQIDSSVVNLMAFAFPVFKMERLDKVKSTFSDSSFNDIFRLAIITSKFTMIGMA